MGIFSQFLHNKKTNGGGEDGHGPGQAGSLVPVCQGGGHGAKSGRKQGFMKSVCLVLASSLVSSALVGGGLYYKFAGDMKALKGVSQGGATLSGVSPVSSSSPLKGAVNLALDPGSPVTAIAKKVGPSIVGIRVVTESPRRWYLDGGAGQSTVEGSGIIISSDGYVMTNYHVVQYADPKSAYSQNTTLEVFLSDKRQVKAKFIGGDESNDLAVIKVGLTGLPAAELGDSSALEVGEQAVAIGNPLGMEFQGSVTVGVISALNRVVNVEDKTLNLIQTDAAINPGNSGGALVNSRGQVIGINTVKISVTGVEGLGFAIPINDAKPIVDQLILFGYVKGRPFIGISGLEITEVMARQYDLTVGIYIQQVTSGSGADKAGIKKGDILVSLADKDVRTMKDIDTIKKNYKAGDTVNAVVVRNGERIKLSLTFSEER
ncbi:MAG: trypsin-like peptidase domain-containing protein [Clostridiales bacterium]|nr:trypsin-like peptidase domain-containing protein [Eubacteriales bacterium]MDH7566367.1 trypsin-like peptidase domain-containing protein [Clostridiales bacterium]